MRLSILTVAFSGLAAAQILNMTAIDDAPRPDKTMAPFDSVVDSVSYPSAEALAKGAAAIAKRNAGHRSKHIEGHSTGYSRMRRGNGPATSTSAGNGKGGDGESTTTSSSTTSASTGKSKGGDGESSTTSSSTTSASTGKSKGGDGESTTTSSSTTSTPTTSPSTTSTRTTSPSTTSTSTGNSKGGDGESTTTSTSTTSTRTTSPSTTSTSTSKSGITTTSSSSSSSTSSTMNTVTVTTPTTKSGTTSSSTSSSTSACPTTPEAGTYCGFINPLDPCAIQPDGYGPKFNPDTTSAFQNYAPFHTQAQQAKNANSLYVKTYSDIPASSTQNSYLALITLMSYDVPACSAACDSNLLCTGFNLYVERDPSVNPAAKCSNPSSITNFKCTLWGSGLDPASATNFGEKRMDFEVVIAGSVAYDKSTNFVPPTPKGYTISSRCPNGAVNNPSTNLGTKFFSGPFDVTLCAGYTTAYNAGADKKSQAATVNAYMVNRDGVAQGTYCALFSNAVTCSDANYQPGTMNGHVMTVKTSFILSTAGSS